MMNRTPMPGEARAEEIEVIYSYPAPNFLFELPSQSLHPCQGLEQPDWPEAEAHSPMTESSSKSR